jgi:cytochrome c biogenesis protein CcmG, thiol:disulfide interchange protein DsbE
MRRIAIPLAAVALVAVVVLGLTQAGGQKSEPPGLTLAQMHSALEGAPPRLDALYRQANTVLGGSTPAFQRQVAALRGYPIVINKWASWCGPCRTEFPVFERVAASLGKRVAFLGVNANDNDAAARRFLAKEPLPYPSYSDRRLAISSKLGIVPYFPTTVFLDARGKRQYIHQGYYASADALEADIRRYVLGQS